MRREIIPRFAEPFGIISDFLDEELRKKLIEKVEDLSQKWVGTGQEVWESNDKSPKNSFGLDDHGKVYEFNLLSEQVTNEVQGLANELSIAHNFTCVDAWYNLYTKDQFQEFHNHTPCLFSSIYFCKLPVGSSSVIFNDFTRTKLSSFPEKRNHTLSEMFNDIYSSPFEENSLIIFRSHIPHSVPFGNNDENRITFSFNFI